MRRRVRGVYLAWANPVFLTFFSFNRINNLRVFSVAFSPIPTAPTNKSPVKHWVPSASAGTLFAAKTDL
jgi:hypothetical protein